MTWFLFFINKVFTLTSFNYFNTPLVNFMLLVSRFSVGQGGLEPPTSPLSGVRSNQLSYRPMGRRKNLRMICDVMLV